jgi:hypothetical protein
VCIAVEPTSKKFGSIPLRIVEGLEPWRLKSLRKRYNDILEVGCFTWSMVHCRAPLSGRQRKKRVPCRNRPPVKWSYWTSTTSFGDSGCHSAERSADQRLGLPGAWPVKPGDFTKASSLAVNCLRWD